VSKRVEWSKPDPLDGCPWGCGAQVGHGDLIKCPPGKDDEWGNSGYTALGTRSQLIGDIAAIGTTIEEAGSCEVCSRILRRRVRVIADEVEKRRQT
jgi:hypothetical protein